MNIRTITKLLAFVAAASLAACAAGQPDTTIIPGSAPHGNPTVAGNATLATIVGVGDSLTAGFQSQGLFGGLPGSVPNPIAAGLPVAAIGVPPTQENGFFSDLYQQAKGVPWVAMANPSTSVLPLIAGPGLGDQIVPANPKLTGGLPFGTLPNRSACDGFNTEAYNLNALATVRENPNATTYDLGIPSLTLHEAITMANPISPQCAPLANVNPLIDGLQAAVNGESQMYYPVLGSYVKKVTNPSALNVAVSLRPTLTTVWLGANDLLKFAFSGGQFAAGDLTESATQTDITTIVKALQNVGSRVAVADLPMVLQTPQFASIAIPPAATITQACQLQTYVFCLLVNDFGQTPQQAQATVTAISTAYKLGTTGYLTESGLIDLLQGKSLDPSGPGSGLGANYLTPAFAAEVSGANAAINAGIQAAAKSTGAAYVPISSVFNDLATGNTSSPYFLLAVSVNPGKCCTLTFGGGIFSYDGLHPSNTGYALVADIFINAINSAYGTGITPLAPADIQAIYAGSSPATRVPYPDPYAQH